MMGGDIMVVSELGKGSTFTVCLPVNCEGAAKKNKSSNSLPLTQTRQERLPESMRAYPSILVIDDDPMVHQCTQSHLRNFGVFVYSAFTGEDGIALAHEIVPNAIILDVQMPSMSGWEVLKELKAQPLTSGIPIILLTIDDEQHDSCEIGANDYLFKPIDRDVLITTIEKYRAEATLSIGKFASMDEPLSVLVVEDDIHVASMLKRMLEKENCIVNEAQDGHEALEAISKNMPQLILLDLMMPNIDGFEFIHLLRLRHDIQSIPIVIITAKDLNDADYIRLSGSVQKILLKTKYSYVQLLQEIVQRLYKFGVLVATE
jgi:CheY-like chemotaxis protein